MVILGHTKSRVTHNVLFVVIIIIVYVSMYDTVVLHTRVFCVLCITDNLTCTHKTFIDVSR